MRHTIQRRVGTLLQSVFVCVCAFSLLHISTAQPNLNGWNRAVGLWGKRSMDYGRALGHSYFVEKRPEQNWMKLNSLWGKRADVEIPFGYPSMER
ncbi:hypothetical protein AB6A40_010665 [Gnathostoma spinigerum]|uniref:Uncharacterized protein n=1 Tax=Gnathostoma spinigerum TaxID=75299 RepID=A0ABD6EX80_9BILA